VSEPRTKLEHVERPWGLFETFAKNEPCTVKVITVEPGRQLSLQYHHERDEYWRILDAGLEVTVGEETVRAEPGDEFFIPRGDLHRLACRGDAPARLLEVAFGRFDEDDIVRVEDDYGRT
jgi:mannose-6-phosphate isomerase